MKSDRQHQATCDWNLYAEQRPDPDLCNIDCLSRPEEVAAAWAALDEMESVWEWMTHGDQ